MVVKRSTVLSLLFPFLWFLPYLKERKVHCYILFQITINIASFSFYYFLFYHKIIKKSCWLKEGFECATDGLNENVIIIGPSSSDRMVNSGTNIRESSIVQVVVAHSFQWIIIRTNEWKKEIRSSIKESNTKFLIW